MKTSSLQNRLSISAVLATLAVVSFLIFQSQVTDASSPSEEGVVAQVENILSISARHVFDEDYWIANMHSIRSSQF